MAAVLNAATSTSSKAEIWLLLRTAIWALVSALTSAVVSAAIWAGVIAANCAVVRAEAAPVGKVVCEVGLPKCHSSPAWTAHGLAG